MRVLVTGGTGFVGRALIPKLLEQGHQAAVLTRSATHVSDFPPAVNLVRGDPARPGAWQDEAARCEAVINLAGSAIYRRWNGAEKKVIRDSRILTTRHLVQALSARRGKETVLLSASGVGYYGFTGEEELDENGPAGADFLAGLSADWEKEARVAESAGVRVALCRFGIVLGKGGGALGKMLPAFRLGLGSPLGSGRQWFPWIHLEDLVRVLLYLLEQREISGPVNCTAPHPVRNLEFTRALSKALRRPSFLPAVPGFALKAALGEFGNVLLQGQRAVPARLLQHGFAFRFPEIDATLRDLLSS